MFSGVGLGEYFAANGLGAGPIVHEISPAMRNAANRRRRLHGQVDRHQAGPNVMQFAGVGAGPMVHEISPRMRAVEAQRRMMRALRSAAHPVVQGARPEFQMFNPAQMHGMGEYFAANGLGADAAPVAPDATKYAMWAGGGAVVGLLAATMFKKSKLVGGGIGAVVGAGALYYADQTTLT